MAIAFLGWIAAACDLLVSPGDWTCEVTINAGGRGRGTGSGTASSQDDALSRAWSSACSDFNLDASDTRRCERGENPGFATWDARHTCETVD